MIGLGLRQALLAAVAALKHAFNVMVAVELTGAVPLTEYMILTLSPVPALRSGKQVEFEAELVHAAGEESIPLSRKDRSIAY